jgi:hypothetical protein
MRRFHFVATTVSVLGAVCLLLATTAWAQGPNSGKNLFERETFGGNGRTCLTCHSQETGTVSPDDALRRFLRNPDDPLFVHDGSDDGLGNGVTRMVTDATILMEIPLRSNVILKDDPTARTVILRRGIPTTLNTPALDPVLMLDGRQPNLQSQAAGAIHDHAQATQQPTTTQLNRIAEFQLTDAFFSSTDLRNFARGGDAPRLPKGRTDSEKRGRRFFEESVDGICGHCHGGPMLNATNQFFPIPVPVGTRFQSVLVSELNAAGNPMQTFIFTNSDGSKTEITSPDPGRALISGVSEDFGTFDHVNAFKIPTLWGIGRTAPYFHDNSAQTLEDVVAHYATFFAIVSDPDGPGPAPPFIILTDQDQKDIVAFMKLLE